MRKLKLQVQMSVNGCIAGRNDEMDWLTWNWDDDMKRYVAGISENIGTILLGRKMTEGFIAAWSALRERDGDPEQAFARKMMDTPKVVFSKTLTQSNWENTVLATGGLVEEISGLKQKPGQDIMAYGGAGFASSLIRHSLIDELYLFVNPVITGGKSIFEGVEALEELRLVEARQFSCGIALLRYERAAML